MKDSTLKTLSLANIQHLDRGRPSIEFNGLLKAVMKDLVERPGVKAKRKVALILEMKPETNDRGDLLGVATTVKIKSAIPDTTSPEYRMVVKGKRGEEAVLFQPDSPDDPAQEGLPFDDDETVDQETGEVVDKRRPKPGA